MVENLTTVARVRGQLLLLVVKVSKLYKVVNSEALLVDIANAREGISIQMGYYGVSRQHCNSGFHGSEKAN